MATTRAERTAVKVGEESPIPTLWAGLSRSQMLELLVPGAAIGLVGGAVAGGLAGMAGLSPLVVVMAAVSLALPLAIGGAIFDLLVTMGRMPLGFLTPAALYWLVAFPVARAINAATVSAMGSEAVAVPNGWLDFTVYNMLLGIGYGMGFWWMHQNYAPRWYFRLRRRNPVASYLISVQLEFANWQNEQREAKKQERKDERMAKRASRDRGR